MSLDLDYDADDQDQAETFDETNITDDGGDIAHPDMERDVLDVTHAEEDDEDDDFDDEAADEDFDPDEADDAEIDSMLEEDDGVDSPGASKRDPADLVMESDSTPADFEADEGPVDDDVDDYADDDASTSSSAPTPKKERELDHGIEETFPASDPVSINPGAD